MKCIKCNSKNTHVSKTDERNKQVIRDIHCKDCDSYFRVIQIPIEEWNTHRKVAKKLKHVVETYLN